MCMEQTVWQVYNPELNILCPYLEIMLSPLQGIRVTHQSDQICGCPKFALYCCNKAKSSLGRKELLLLVLLQPSSPFDGNQGRISNRNL